MRIWTVATLVMLGTGAIAATQADIAEYARLSATFDARQGKADIGPDRRLQLADCVLSAFEAARGSQSIPQLMALMRTVSAGVQFDDPVVVKFTENHGDVYAQIVKGCRSSVANG